MGNPSASNTGWLKVKWWSTAPTKARVSQRSQGLASWDTALCMTDHTRTPSRLAALATPRSAGARAACQKGRTTTSTSWSCFKDRPTRLQVPGFIESNSAGQPMSDGPFPGSHWLFPGNKVSGYCRDQVMRTTSWPWPSRAVAMASLNWAMPPRNGGKVDTMARRMVQFGTRTRLHQPIFVA